MVMLGCEEAANEDWINAPDPDYCFAGTKTRGMSDEEFKALSELWERRNDTIAVLRML